MTRWQRGVLALVVVLGGLAAVGRYAGGFPQIIAFILAAFALAGLAWAVSFATDQIGRRYGPAITGVLQATIGNLPEFFVVLFALQAHDKTVAETALIGSILVNALLVLGLVLLTGSSREHSGLMRFSAALPNDTATLMLIASLTIVLIGIVTDSHDPAGHHAQTISIVGAAAMLMVYGVWMRQYLRGDQNPDPEAEGAEQPQVSMRTALTLLIGAGLGAAFVSDWFVHALEPTIRQVHLSQAFAGLVIVAIAGNAVENSAGVYMAYKGKHDLAIAIVKNSVAQIAAFLYPLMVLVSLATATHLTFALAPVWIGALLGTAILIWQITGDGEATPFEGTALIAVYVVLAMVAAFEH